MIEQTRLTKRARRDLIVAELRASAAVRISELAARLGVSGETIRRDLRQIGQGGLISRTYGGAVARPFAFEPDWTERQSAMGKEREKIADIAAGLVQAGEALMLDSGATALHFARRLAATSSELTVITNSLPAATALGVNPNLRVIFCPGTYDAREGCVVGPDTVAFLQRFRANRALISASGLTADGPTEVNSGAAAVKRAMLSRAAERILLLDHEKFDKPHLEVVCPLTDLHRLVTDAPVPLALGIALRDAGIEVLS